MCTTSLHEVFGGPGGVVDVVSSASRGLGLVPPPPPSSAAWVVLAPLEPHAATSRSDATSIASAVDRRERSGVRRITAAKARCPTRSTRGTRSSASDPNLSDPGTRSVHDSDENGRDQVGVGLRRMAAVRSSRMVTTDAAGAGSSSPASHSCSAALTAVGEPRAPSASARPRPGGRRRGRGAAHQPGRLEPVEGERHAAGGAAEHVADGRRRAALARRAADHPEHEVVGEA